MFDILTIVLTVLGLALFEIITSIDNAVINADVLSTMSKRARRWFLIWGLFIAVFLVRGFLPFAVLWVSNPSLGPLEVFAAAFSSDPLIAQSMEHSRPILLVAGGVFLVFLFLHWLFIEPKNYGLRGEKKIHNYGIWFYAVVSVLLCAVVWFASQITPLMAFGAVVGSTAFFITHGFKQNAEEQEKKLLRGSSLTDTAKIFYLEVIDAAFSVDGVVGAFAFTMSVPLILIGNGLGALVVRQLTVSNIENVKKYKYLKNGAMYSVFFLGCIMLVDSFGLDIPEFVSPIITFVTIGYFFMKSKKELEQKKKKRN